jgi:hypothetical protein
VLARVDDQFCPSFAIKSTLFALEETFQIAAFPFDETTRSESNGEALVLFLNICNGIIGAWPSGGLLGLADQENRPPSRSDHGYLYCNR